MLSLYSVLNILILNGDRLFEAALQWYQLSVLVTILVFGIWYTNLIIESVTSGKEYRVHPLIVQFLTSIVGITFISILSVLLTSKFLGDPYTLKLINFKLTLGFTFRVNLFVNSINAVVYFNFRYKEKELEAEKLKTLTSQAQLESLSNQINPHFLFNSLNVLSTLIHKDADQADEFVQKLSTTYRYILNNRKNELVTVEEEMTFVKDYLDLLKVRFGEALKVQLDVIPSRDYYLPPAVLQLLVENVIKHNIVSLEHPITLNISDVAVSNHITVENNKRLKPIAIVRTGIGLSNISSRYKFLDHRITIEETDHTFKVAVPILKLEQNENSNN